jgi:hypothetical protein
MKHVMFLSVLLFSLAAGALQAQAALRPGDMCLAYWEENDLYYVGTVAAEDNTVKGGGYLVIFADADQAVVPRDRVKPFTIKAGSKVLALWSDGDLYPGTVSRIIGGALYIEFDDGDKGWTSWSGIAMEAE